MFKMKFIPFFAVVLFLFSSCHTKTVPSTDIREIRKINDYQVMADLYNYYSAEYKALAYQAYNLASARLDQVRAKKPGARNLAVVVDIDETLLDNSPYQARMVQLNASYDSCWNTWCNLASARAVPGSVEFLDHADSLGFNIFYVSNRKNAYVRKGTMENLNKLGFPQLDDQHIYLREKDSDKEPRRIKISEKYEIVLLVGDNIADFYEDTNIFGERDSLVTARKNEFGRKFIVLPNAMYGNWPASIGITPGHFPLDSLLDLMTRSFTNNCPQ